MTPLSHHSLNLLLVALETMRLLVQIKSTMQYLLKPCRIKMVNL